MNFATGWIDRKDVHLRLASASMSAGNYIRRSILQSNILSIAKSRSVSVKMCSPMWNYAIFGPSLADLKPMWNASETVSSATSGIYFRNQLVWMRLDSSRVIWCIIKRSLACSRRSVKHFDGACLGHCLWTVQTNGLLLETLMRTLIFQHRFKHFVLWVLGWNIPYEKKGLYCCAKCGPDLSPWV